MAIYQISKLQNRKGLQIDLPLLSGGELGWSVDERRLWIGNGTIQEGAPVIGNTEILTEFSDIFNMPKKYTYRGDVAGYVAQTGPTPNSPVRQSLQNWMDQFVSVKDFGAVGDGITDDTLAINRALNELYCVVNNPQSRRGLYFPAGAYLVSDTIRVPPFATLRGDGPQNSFILMAQTSTAKSVAQTADSAQAIDVSMGSVGSFLPQEITVRDFGFISQTKSADPFIVNSTTGAHFENVAFLGAGVDTDMWTDQFMKTAAVRIISTTAMVSSNIRLIDCEFGFTTWGIATLEPLTGNDSEVVSVTVDNCSFDTHYRGVILGTGANQINGGPRGFRITNCVFNEVYAEGVIFGNCHYNATGYNTFLEVGNHLLGATQPWTAMIDIQSDDNLTVGDLFNRKDQYALSPAVPGTTFPRITLHRTISIGFAGTESTRVGNYTRYAGKVTTLLDNVATPTPITTPASTGSVIVGVDSTICSVFRVDYTMTRLEWSRVGSFTVAYNGGSVTSPLIWDDTFTENGTLGVWIYAAQNPASNFVYLTYESDIRAADTTFTYSIVYLT